MKNLRKKLATLGAAIALAAVGMVSGAAPASANSFTQAIWGNYLSPIITYNDGGDLFCMATKRYPIPGSVTVVLALTPVNGVGPSFYNNVIEGSKTCWSLSRAYEDTRYKWTVIAHQQGFPATVYVGYFYS